MTSTSTSSLSRRFFWSCLVAGFLPLGVQIFLWIRRPGTTAPNALGAAALGALILLALAWALTDRLSRAVAGSLRSIRDALTRAANSDFSARVEVAGWGCELAELGNELSDLIEKQQREILDLRLEAEQAAALRESSRQLIEECIYAREPLAKQHPGLAAAYAAAAMRQAGREEASENETVDGLVHSVGTVGHSRGNRENLRWTVKDVRVDVPLPSTLVNMSVKGMAVESTRGLPVGGSWIFRVGNEALAYDIPGRIRWCRLERTVKIDDEVQPIYRTGVEFDDRLSGKAFNFFGPAALVSGPAESAAW